MAPDGNEHQVIARIGFAERWLHRAKRHYGDGDTTRGFLSVVVAKAEMHYALESSGRPRRATPRMWVPAVLMVGAIAGCLAVASDWFLPPPAVSGAAATTPIVRLTAPVGTWLNLVQTVAISSPSPPAVFHQQVPGLQRVVPRIVQVRPASSPVVHVVAPADAAGASTAASPETTAVVLVPPQQLSAADLIDLAITADRTLRRVPTP